EGHALVVPQCNVGALALLQECEVRTMTQLAELADRGRLAMQTRAVGEATSRCDPAVMAPSLDLADVRGQWQAKRALLVAAAGGHGLLMCGPPGSGKSMLAQRLPGLLPPLSREEALEVAAIGAVARQSPAGHRFGARPFRAPHHTASAHAIVGGGVAVRPGEVSLAHHGVLFLDELPEFDRRVLEALREPLESGAVSVVRANQRADYPARFQLVAAMNPCPCGRAGQLQPRCRCEPKRIERYRARISGPLLDRIDLQLSLPAVDVNALTGPASTVSTEQSLTTADALAQVCAARERQQLRQGCCNARLDAGETLRHCEADVAGMQLLRRVAQQQGHSARSQHRILRVARSIADLAGRDAVTANDIAEALAMRWEQ
ncbi:MAG TPA: YifB family Mg chelatase-like AAA ATPase, partial [Steroidobacteraceae bacterium]|nr:YifB family Mg chelatase-like AAA ATPase [Steroidobacteraceae bacterium]